MLFLFHPGTRTPTSSNEAEKNSDEFFKDLSGGEKNS